MASGQQPPSKLAPTLADHACANLETMHSCHVHRGGHSFQLLPTGWAMERGWHFAVLVVSGGCFGGRLMASDGF